MQEGLGRTGKGTFICRQLNHIVKAVQNSFPLWEIVYLIHPSEVCSNACRGECNLIFIWFACLLAHPWSRVVENMCKALELSNWCRKGLCCWNAFSFIKFAWGFLDSLSKGLGFRFSLPLESKGGLVMPSFTSNCWMPWSRDLVGLPLWKGLHAHHYHVAPQGSFFVAGGKWWSQCNRHSFKNTSVPILPKRDWMEEEKLNE